MDILKLVQETKTYKLEDELLMSCIKNPAEALKDVVNDEQRFPIFFGILKRLWDILFIQSEMITNSVENIHTESKLYEALQIVTPRYLGTINFIVDMGKIKPENIKRIEFDRDTFLVLFTLYDYYNLMMSQQDAQKALITHYYGVACVDMKGLYMKPIMVEVTNMVNSHQNNISDCLMELKGVIKTIKNEKVQNALYAFMENLMKSGSETMYAKIIEAANK